jgi:hypothetical protein
MKTFKDYLFERHNIGGTYASLILSAKSGNKLHAFLEELDLDNLVEEKDYHCTLLYSRTEVDAIRNEDFMLPCYAEPTGYEILGEEDKVLVLLISCSNAKRLHRIFINEYGGTHDYDDYAVHITICNSFSGSLPTELPKFKLVFDDMLVEEIKP